MSSCILAIITTVLFLRSKLIGFFIIYMHVVEEHASCASNFKVYREGINDPLFVLFLAFDCAIYVLHLLCTKVASCKSCFPFHLGFSWSQRRDWIVGFRLRIWIRR